MKIINPDGSIGAETVVINGIWVLVGLGVLFYAMLNTPKPYTCEDEDDY